MVVAGTMRERVTIQAADPAAADAKGASADVWADVVTVWAEVQMMAGTETLVGERIEPQTIYTVTIRYYADLNNRHRFRFGTLYLYPYSIIPDPKRTQQVCLCRRRG